MSNIVTGYGNSPAFTSMFDSSKGSFKNRVDCTVQRLANTARGTVEVGALGAATYGGYKLISNLPASKTLTSLNGKVTKFVEKGANIFSKAAKWLKSGSKDAKGFSKLAGKALSTVTNGAEKALKFVAGLSGKQKALGALGLAAAAALIGLERKHAFKEGQIDQKYTDKAKIDAAKDNLFPL